MSELGSELDSWSSFYITNGMPRLSGNLVFLPNQRLFWIVNASMVTERLLV